MPRKTKTIAKLRESARGEACTLMIYPYCNGNTETTVLCHLPSADHGMGIKSPDWWGCYGCSDCHDIIDNRRKVLGLTYEMKVELMFRALYRTWKRMIEKGLIGG